MPDDPPRRPRRASLDVILIVAAMLLIAAFVAMIVLFDANVRWARKVIEHLGKPEWIYEWQGGVLLLLLAAARSRGAVPATSGDLPRRPRRASRDAILIVAAMLLIAAFVALFVLAGMGVRPARGAVGALATMGLVYVWQGTALVLLTAALIVRLRRR